MHKITWKSFRRWGNHRRRVFAVLVCDWWVDGVSLRECLRKLLELFLSFQNTCIPSIFWAYFGVFSFRWPIALPYRKVKTIYASKTEIRTMLRIILAKVTNPLLNLPDSLLLAKEISYECRFEEESFLLEYSGFFYKFVYSPVVKSP